MTSNWEKFKQKTETPTGEVQQGRKIGTSFPCQVCNKRSVDATYYPVDGIVRYECSEGHISFIENFKLAF